MVCGNLNSGLQEDNLMKTNDVKLPFIVISKSLQSWLDKRNPERFEREEMAHLFGLLLPGRLEGREVLVLTHAYQAPGIRRSFANVNTNTSGVRDSLQIVQNGLTITAQILGLIGSTVGTWHTHPDSVSTGPSPDDLETYRKSARTSQIGFWLGPIACRYSFRKYTTWYIYVESLEQVYEIPKDHIIESEDMEVKQFQPGLERFLQVNPVHFLSDLEGEYRVLENRKKDMNDFEKFLNDIEGGHNALNTSLRLSQPAMHDILQSPKRPSRLPVALYNSAVSLFLRIQWFEVMAVASFIATLILYFLLFMSHLWL
jgi:hypothetical protein